MPRTSPPTVPPIRRFLSLGGLFAFLFWPAHLTLAAPPAGIDLDVTYINRAEMYDRYQVEYPNGRPKLGTGTEADQRWPAPGELVTLTAHVTNKGTLDSPAFLGQWRVDGDVVRTINHGPLAAGASTTFTYQWAWDHTLSADGQRILDDHSIAFRVDPRNDIAETFENNNEIEDLTNAYSLRFYIQQHIYDGYETPRLAGTPHSAEDWLQHHITAMNNLFEVADSPVRVRLNDITITENNPRVDHSHDGAWFFRDNDYRDFSGFYEAATDIDWGLLHELAHQLGLIDLYQYNIPVAAVQVRERSGDGVNFGYNWEDGGLMEDVGHYFSAHTLFGANSTWGYRRGYYGEYQFSMPRITDLRVFDNTGAVVPDAQVALFQRNGPPDWVGGRAVDNTAEITGTTNPSGTFRLPNRPIEGADLTTTTGHTLTANPFGPVNVVGQMNSFLVRVTKEAHEEFSWLHVTDLNEAFAAGSTDRYIHRIQTRFPAAEAPPTPTLQTPEVTGSMARLCWSPVPGATKYTVYGITAPDSRYEEIATLDPATRCIDVTHSRSTVYAVSATGANNLESGLSNTEWTPRLNNPVDLKEDVDGNIMVLDPQNGQNLLRMKPDGHYLGSFGSEHFHLNGSRYFAKDRDDNLAFSYQQLDPHSGQYVRLTDAAVQPAGGITDPLQGPTGIDFWGDLGDCQLLENPTVYQSGSTLFLARFENSLLDQRDVAPANSSGVSYAAGRFGRGVVISANDRLSYATDHINLPEGTIQFWVKPSWNGTDPATYVFFEAGQPFNNGMRIQKDGAGNLRFIIWDGAVEYGVGRSIADWTAGEWYLVGAKWKGTTLSLHIDGINVAETDNGSVLSSIAGALHIGSSFDGNGQVDATLDEFVISNTAFFPHEFCDVAYLVADHGNNLLRAFDLNGNLIDSHAGLNGPEGVAVAPDGTVWVVDSGNNRLRTFQFDGAILSPGPIITSANLRAPTGIDISANGEVAVSDTGNNAVKILDPDGTLLQTLNTPVGNDAGTLLRPGGVLYHSRGGVFVADTGNRRVVQVQGDRFLHAATEFVIDDTSGRLYYEAPFGRQLLGVQQTPGLRPASWTDIQFTAGIDMGRPYVEVPVNPLVRRRLYRLAFTPPE